MYHCCEGLYFPNNQLMADSGSGLHVKRLAAHAQGVLLQIFTKPLSDRPTVFVEIIQRIGCEQELRGPAGTPACWVATGRAQEAWCVGHCHFIARVLDDCASPVLL